jgi:RsiW-degrading membrane proteinase PrsW (M82 family)
LQLLIPGILGVAAAHMAESGFWGYFIGLSALKPSKRWPILGVGYFSEAALHALSKASVVGSVLFGALLGVLSYAFLVAAI